MADDYGASPAGAVVSPGHTAAGIATNQVFKPAGEAF
jgi:hypothetical protein